MPKVWVTHEIEVDYSAAEQYGEVEVVTSRDISSLPGSHINKELMAQIRDAMRKYDEGDYILSSGSPYVSMLCLFWVGRHRRAETVRFLRWSKQNKRYFPVTVDVHTEIAA